MWDKMGSRSNVKFGRTDWSDYNVWCFRVCDIHKNPHLTTNGCIESVEDEHLSHSAFIGASTAASLTTSSIAELMKNKEIVKLKESLARIRNAGLAGNGSMFSLSSGFAAGAISGGMATYSTHWLDTTKTKMQSFPSRYAGGYQCIRLTLQTEGVRGLYQGAAPAVIGQMCKTATVFMSYELCQDLVSKATGCSKEDLSLWHRASSGAMTGVVASFVLCPMELIKCRKQTLSANLSSTRSGIQTLTNLSATQLARQAVRNEGIRGLYRGLPGIWVKEVPGTFIYMGSYECAKAAMRHLNETPHLSSRAVFLCGMTAGLAYCVMHPIETVKTRVQVMSAKTPGQPGFLVSFFRILKKEGVRPLMSGLKPCVIRSCLYSGIQFVTYEYVRNYFMERHEK